jgi:zinc/manganese transport system permease protein
VTLLADATSTGLTDMLTHPFIRHALLAGTGIAAASGLVGYFVVLRSQVFSGDALSHVAFTGALAALAFGLDARLGLFAATIAVGLALGLLGNRGHADDVVIGTVFTWILGLGVLFLSIFTASNSTSNGTASTTVLFGSIFGLSASQAGLAACIGIGICALIVVIARPLLFATLDPDVALARRIPVRALGIVFLGLVGVCAAEATQAVGALLLLGLMAAPAGAAQRLTNRPYVALWLSALIAVACVWGGITASYLVTDVPPTFGIMALATAIYIATFAITAARHSQTRRNDRQRRDARDAGAPRARSRAADTATQKAWLSAKRLA